MGFKARQFPTPNINQLQEYKDKIIAYFKENIKGDNFIINQKIIEAIK